MSAGLLSKWMGHPNVANMNRRAPMARGRMHGYDIEDDSSEFVDQFPGKELKGICKLGTSQSTLKIRLALLPE